MNELVKAWLDSLTLSHRLSPAERLEVFRIAQNKTAKEAADELGLAEETVRSKRKALLKKLEIDNTKTMLYQMLEFACSRNRRDYETAADTEAAAQCELVEECG